MSKPALDPIADARTWPRYFARASILAPMAAVLVLFVARQLERERPEAVAEAINMVASTFSALVVLAGLGLGIAGFIGGRRRRSLDTMMIASLGLFLTGIYLVLTAWALVFMASR